MSNIKNTMITKIIAFAVMTVILIGSMFTVFPTAMTVSAATKYSIVYVEDGKENTVTIKNGSNNGYVAYAQQLLNELGYNAGAVDGIFGTNTLNAVKSFQKAKGLTQDGIVGVNTWNALKSTKRTFDPSRVRFVVVINDREGAVGAGHQALICVDTKGAYKVISFGPKNNPTRNIETGEYYTLCTKLNTTGRFKFGNTNYDRWYIREVSMANGKKIHDTAVNNWNSFYFLLGNQCDDVTSRSMKAGGVGYWVGGTPNVSFDNIVKTWANVGVGKNGGKDLNNNLSNFKAYIAKYCDIY